MSDQLKIQAAVEMSTESAEGALDRVGDAAAQMAGRLQREGAKAGAAVDGIGAGAEKSADQFSRAEGRMAASIKRATANLETLGKTASEKLEWQINQKGLDASKFEPALAKLRELEAANTRVGLSAAQMTNNLRMVPAQMTDIVTSLASGQQPLTVLIQQGGQLKDMFGGIGAATRAVGGYIAGMINPVTVTAAAVGGLGYALYAASAEADEFKKNLILTGNVSGITLNKFNELAASLDGLDGVTRGGAAEALTAIAASGNISADAIGRLTASALKLERAGGQAVADTVKQFEELGKAPVAASLKLNEQTHYLTLAVYEQIKALEDQGRTSDAAALAQKAWADAIEQRTPKMVENIGYLESAWKGVKWAAAEALNAMKGIGREDTYSEKFRDLQIKIAEADDAIANKSINSNRLKQQRAQWKAELAELIAANNAKIAEASRAREQQEKEDKKIAASTRWDKLAESQRSKREQYAAELRKLDADRAADLISEAKYRQAKADLAKKYEEKASSAKPKKSDEEKDRDRQAKLDAEDWSRRVAYAQRVAAGMEKETDAIWAKVNAEVAAREAVGKSRVEIEARTLALMNEQLAWRDALGLQDEETEQLKRNIAAQQALMDAVRDTDSAKQVEAQGKAAAEAHRKAAEAAAAEWQKTVDRIDQTFHDGFVGMLEKGKADWESFADSIANTFKTAVADEIYKLTLRPLVLQVAAAFTGGQPGVADQAQGFGGVISNLQSAYAGVTGGISNAANSFALSGMGQWAGLSTPGVAMGPPTAAGVYGSTASVTAAGAQLTAAAAPVAGALAAAAVTAELMKAGWGPDNNRKSALVASLSPGTIIGATAIDRLFGRNRNISNDAAGIRGTFDLTGFSGEQFQERSQKGGTFRSDKRWTEASAIASDMDAALDSMLKQTVSGLQSIGKTLNVESIKALEGFSHEFQLQLTENGDWSKASEKIAAEVAKVSDELVTRLVPNIADLSRYGESASQAFERLNQEVQATDAILLAMGKSAAEAFGGVGLASIAAREHLIDLAGGLESLAGKTQFFYANFYSQSEQLQLAGKQAKSALDAGFSELGLSIPTTREAFRSLVESQDLSTESGRKLFNGLLSLADEFKAVADAADDAGTGSKKIAEVAKQASEQATGQLASIFDTFASDTQKLDAAKKLVSDTFASIGEKVPSSAAEFLALAQSIDPATEAGQGFVAALAKVSNAFAYTQTAAANAAAAAISSANAAASAYFAGVDAAKRASTLTGEGMSAIDVLFGNINDQAKTAAESAASAASDTANAWRSASQSIKSALDNIRTGALSSLSPEARYRLLQSQFATTSASAASGNVDAVGKLGQIATDFLEASRDYNASSEAFQADRAAADAALSKSLSYASAQVSTQEAIASASRAAVDQLQSLNSNLSDFGKQALELLQKGYAGIDRHGATVAVGKLAEMQTAFDRWFGNTQAGEVTRDKQVFGDAYWTRLAGDMASFTGSDGAVSYIRASESLLDIAKRIPELRADWEKQFGISLPSYAVGTPFVPEDQIAQIHQGEMIIPASAAAQLRKYGIGSQPDNGLQAEILAELRTTRQSQQQSYGAMQQQLAASNAKLAAVERRLAAMEDQARLQRAGS